MPVARAVSHRRPSTIPDFAILAAVVAVLAASGGMMLGFIPIPF